MSQRQLSIFGCALVSLCFVALCCGSGAFFWLNAAEIITLIQPPVPIATSDVLTPIAKLTPILDSTPEPSARATVSPRIPFPTLYSITTRYPVTLSESYNVQPYSVSGSTPDEIRRDLNGKGVIDRDLGRRFDAETRWRLEGSWNWNESTRGCEIRDADLNLQVTLTMPTLAVTSSTSDNLLSGWNKFIERLKIHEDGHIEIDVREARRLRDDFANFPIATDCATIRINLQSRFDETINNLKQLNSKYDADTGHGATQGAIFP